eukprot:7352597-Prymnesium_polylepis.1
MLSAHMHDVSKCQKQSGPAAKPYTHVWSSTSRGSSDCPERAAASGDEGPTEGAVTDGADTDGAAADGAAAGACRRRAIVFLSSTISSR